MSPCQNSFWIIILAHFVAAEVRISLNSNEVNGTWRVCNGNSSINVKATVPGGIYTDLKNANILHDELLYRFNDQSYRWIGHENWTYQAVFNAPNEIFRSTINLVFHGIDTAADICLNGQRIHSANNMFVRYVIPIKDYLKEGQNVLQVRFRSPIHEAKKLADKQAQKYEIPPNCPPAEQYGECHVNFLRKMQASFSWDWGPAFPSVGIWKSVEIEAFDFAIIRDVTVSSIKVDSNWLVNATFFVESALPNLSYVITATIQLQQSGALCEQPITQTEIRGTRNSHSFTVDMQFEFSEAQLDLWWPSGYGNQTLYILTAVISPLNNSEVSNEESTKEVRFGFRTVELVQEKVSDTSPGLSFYFKINGVPIFAKGSNWIPGHVLPELGSKESMLEHHLLSAKEANMNMLRVWGGGVYESDLFYNLADELGILIWQDMMFAVALYPTDEVFLETVREEIKQQITRLQHHPSIALWAGNNENEIALRGNWFNTSSNFELYKKDYITLYISTMEPIVYNNDNSRWFAVSSPSNGLESREEGHIAMFPGSPLYGDVHYYNYEDDPWNASKCINTRFASEYGFQSMPSFSTLAKVSKPEDWKLKSRFSQTRQHHRKGYEEMLHLIRYHLPLPDDDESESFFKKFIYYSQISQAMSIKIQTEKYRRDRGRLTESGEKLTMGALYWQLNDVWQAPTWSSIEFGGKWKILHYYAVKFFAPIIVSFEIESNQLRVFVVSDLLEDVRSQLSLCIYSWNSLKPKQCKTQNIKVTGSKSEVHMEENLEKLLWSLNCTVNTCFLQCNLGNQFFNVSNELYLSPFSSAAHLEIPDLRAKIRKSMSNDEIVVELKTDKVTPFVYLDVDVDGHFSDNGFLLLQEKQLVSFTNRGAAIDIEHFKKTLKVRSLLTEHSNVVFASHFSGEN